MFLKQNIFSQHFKNVFKMFIVNVFKKIQNNMILKRPLLAEALLENVMMLVLVVTVESLTNIYKTRIS